MNNKSEEVCLKKTFLTLSEFDIEDPPEVDLDKMIIDEIDLSKEIDLLTHLFSKMTL